MVATQRKQRTQCKRLRLNGNRALVTTDCIEFPKENTHVIGQADQHRKQDNDALRRTVTSRGQRDPALIN